MSTQSRKTILLATDQQQSVLNALDANQPNPIAYTPYGHRPRGNGLLSLLGFNGELPDPLTGHYHLGKGYRQFNPVLMRFNSPDSWSPFGEGGLNAYAYCWGDPVNSTDPTGHTPKLIKSFLRALRLMRKSPTKVAKKAASTTRHSSAHAPSPLNSHKTTNVSTTAASHGSVPAPPPLNSPKTINELTPNDLKSDDINLDLFSNAGNSRLPPKPTTRTRNIDTSVRADTKPFPLAKRQYEDFLDVSNATANNAPIDELLSNYIWLSETAGPSRLTNKLQHAQEKIRRNLYKHLN
ncbi:RHS repeat-associated core domain protein-containing protein [Pseudomonas sp. GM78]|uniref:RHS repeat-associated core domain-containing protein n=1 Tax=Pseudomonas sp. GM78 TaxID=1144337 RepID=UPI000270A99B|nr:RHS repeat-associated core domain-containing protein [Pseudomonas sp. GM78]EJN30668.1 RHS repeat-associated core domain protein-containing protein [Pseudomonas sp. GM78]